MLLYQLGFNMDTSTADTEMLNMQCFNAYVSIRIP